MGLEQTPATFSSGDQGIAETPVMANLEIEAQEIILQYGEVVTFSPANPINIRIVRPTLEAQKPKTPRMLAYEKDSHRDFDAYLMAAYGQGLSLRAIAKEVGVDTKALRARCATLGLPLRTPQEAAKLLWNDERKRESSNRLNRDVEAKRVLVESGHSPEANRKRSLGVRAALSDEKKRAALLIRRREQRHRKIKNTIGQDAAVQVAILHIGQRMSVDRIALSFHMGHGSLLRFMEESGVPIQPRLRPLGMKKSGAVRPDDKALVEMARANGWLASLSNRQRAVIEARYSASSRVPSYTDLAQRWFVARQGLSEAEHSALARLRALKIAKT